MPDKTDKIATNIGYGVIVAVVVAAVVGIIFFVFKLSIGNFAGSILAPLISIVAISGTWIHSFEVRKSIPMPALVLSAICGFAFMMNNHKYKAEAANFFLPEQIIKHKAGGLRERSKNSPWEFSHLIEESRLLWSCANSKIQR